MTRKQHSSFTTGSGQADAAGSARRRARRGPLVNRVVVAAAAVAMAGAGVLTTGATAAHADSTFTIRLAPDSNQFLLLDMSGASTSIGGGLIQWYADSGNNQNWTFIPYGGTANYMIQNANSGLCLVTDGAAGDQVYQFPCEGAPTEIWHTSITPSLVGEATIMNPATGLYLDVSGSSPWAGGIIDAYPYNAGNNQFFGAR